MKYEEQPVQTGGLSIQVVFYMGSEVEPVLKITCINEVFEASIAPVLGGLVLYVSWIPEQNAMMFMSCVLSTHLH